MLSMILTWHVKVTFDSPLPCSECNQATRQTNAGRKPGFRCIQHESRELPCWPSLGFFVCSMVQFAPTWSCPHLKYCTQKRQSIRKFRCPATPSEVALQWNRFPVAIDKPRIIIWLTWRLCRFLKMLPISPVDGATLSLHHVRSLV